MTGTLITGGIPARSPAGIPAEYRHLYRHSARRVPCAQRRAGIPFPLRKGIPARLTWGTMGVITGTFTGGIPASLAPRPAVVTDRA